LARAVTDKAVFVLRVDGDRAVAGTSFDSLAAKLFGGSGDEFFTRNNLRIRQMIRHSASGICDGGLILD
jgi:hypothetical protein